MTLVDPDGTPLDTWARRIGLRSVAVDTTPDEHGTPFTFVVNGRPLFVKGANWIPDDHLLTRVTRERLARRLDQAVGAGLNLLRVWGGGIYESRGLLRALRRARPDGLAGLPARLCRLPRGGAAPHRVEAEAREQVTRLSCHPRSCCGTAATRTSGASSTGAGRSSSRVAPGGGRTTPRCSPGWSPSSTPPAPTPRARPARPAHALTEVHPNDPDHGTHHEWEVWNRVDYSAYRDAVPRFCSEFGFQGTRC